MEQSWFRPLAATALTALALGAAGCGKSSKEAVKAPEFPTVGAKGEKKQAAAELGFPVFATKNTTRVGGADPIADAAATARAVFPAVTPATRPKVVALVDARDWRTAIAAGALMADPIRAPMLLSDGRKLPEASRTALATLRPLGSQPAGDAQVIRVGDVARPTGLRTTDIAGKDVFAVARALDAFQAAAHGTTSDRVLVVSADDPKYSMPAAAWAAKSGDPILFTHRDQLPPDTRAAIASHQQPKIYVLGPKKAVSGKVERDLRKLGTVKRIQGPDPTRNAIAFSRYLDGDFGWGVTDPGHGLVFVNAKRPSDAVASAPLSSTGKYGPILLHDGKPQLPGPLAGFLQDIRPGYRRDPVRGVYNHGWLIGDEAAVPVAAQSQIDSLLEIAQIDLDAKTTDSP